MGTPGILCCKIHAVQYNESKELIISILEVSTTPDVFFAYIVQVFARHPILFTYHISFIRVDFIQISNDFAHEIIFILLIKIKKNVLSKNIVHLDLIVSTYIWNSTIKVSLDLF